jgi:hypothetical protein
MMVLRRKRPHCTIAKNIPVAKPKQERPRLFNVWLANTASTAIAAEQCLKHLKVLHS